jgi:uncharacterized membrane protein
MLDRLFAIIGFLALIAFMGVVTMFVMEPDLWIVTIVVLCIGIAFVWRDLKPGDNQTEREEDGGSES